MHRTEDGLNQLPDILQIENNRLDLAHEMARMLLGDKLHLAPLDKPQRILDIGTGTGVWAIEMGGSPPSLSSQYFLGFWQGGLRGEWIIADEYPSAEVCRFCTPKLPYA
jgi:hypothetical protein